MKKIYSCVTDFQVLGNRGNLFFLYVYLYVTLNTKKKQKNVNPIRAVLLIAKLIIESAKTTSHVFLHPSRNQTFSSRIFIVVLQPSLKGAVDCKVFVCLCMSDDGYKNQRKILRRNKPQTQSSSICKIFWALVQILTLPRCGLIYSDLNFKQLVRKTSHKRFDWTFRNNKFALQNIWTDDDGKYNVIAQLTLTN